METPRSSSKEEPEGEDSATSRRINYLASITGTPVQTPAPNKAVSSSSATISQTASGDVFLPRTDPSKLSSPEFNHEDGRHLLASLSQARGSIVSLETANKDLLDALNSKQTELDAIRIKNERLEDEISCLNVEAENNRLEYI